jgi:hypothetical protein
LHDTSLGYLYFLRVYKNAKELKNSTRNKQWNIHKYHKEKFKVQIPKPAGEVNYILSMHSIQTGDIGKACELEKKSKFS